MNRPLLVTAAVIATTVPAFAASEIEPASGIAVLFFIAFVLSAYFLPAIIAVVRRHHNRVAIAVLNTALGWTLLGWIAALVWASTATDKQRVRQVRGY